MISVFLNVRGNVLKVFNALAIQSLSLDINADNIMNLSQLIFLKRAFNLKTKNGLTLKLKYKTMKKEYK